jgi:acyl-CoA synthetase (NDP forming)/GNAT superfamily N-acetyltransferase
MTTTPSEQIGARAADDRAEDPADESGIGTTVGPTVAPADVLLADGSVGVVRTLGPEDREALLTLHDEVGLDSLRLRFFSASREAGHAYVEHLLSHHEAGQVLALALWYHDRLVGLATAERNPDVTEAEVSFLVADEMRGHGVGTLLLEHLAALARTQGVRRFTADVLAENGAMIRVFLDAGFQLARHLDRGVVTVEMDTLVSEDTLRAADARESRSEAASLSALLRPRRVAVVGVRHDGSGVGCAVIDSIVQGGFHGELVVIHPTAATVRGVRAYPSFADAPGPIDLVVVAVPPEQVTACVQEAAGAGARAAVVITSGFAEMGAEGRALQRELAHTARSHDIRVVGPNCLGLLDNQPDVRLVATFAGANPPPGGLAIASQSGGVGIVVSDLACRLGLGVRHFVSLGNKADVSSNDLLAAWLDDPDVTAAALYLESFGNPAKFARLARRFAETRPVLAVMGGRSNGGRRAGVSHTAAAATPSVRVDALFAQAGVVGCRDAEELTETALLLAEQPLPTGPRLAILGNAGGLGVLAADCAARHGLTVPVLSDGLRDKIAVHVTGTIGTGNPVDSGAGGTGDGIGQIAAELLASTEVDAILLVLVQTRTLDPELTLRALLDARRAHPAKPVVAVLLGGMQSGPLEHITVLPSVESAVRSLAHAVRYADWLSAPRSSAPVTDPERLAAARTWVASYLDETGPGWLAPDAASALLAPYDVSLCGVVATGPDAAAAASAEVGLPVAVKVADPEVVHKTERGLVRVGLASMDAVRETVERFAAEMGRSEVPVLVQPLVDGPELALGVVRDPGLGPLVMVAAGGTATEVWNDRTLLMAPVSSQDAARALRSLRIWPLLAGYRGSTPVDEQALVAVIVALGRLAADLPEVAEVDLNPVVPTPEGVRLVDTKIRLDHGTAVDAGVPRRLREPV